MLNPDDCDYDTLDPGIRNIVRVCRAAGFDTCDSGDGISKHPDGYASGEFFPAPHVVVQVHVFDIVRESKRLFQLLGEEWNVQATYTPHDEKCILFAAKLDEEPRA